MGAIQSGDVALSRSLVGGAASSFDDLCRSHWIILKIATGSGKKSEARTFNRLCKNDIAISLFLLDLGMTV